MTTVYSLISATEDFLNDFFTVDIHVEPLEVDEPPGQDYRIYTHRAALERALVYLERDAEFIEAYRSMLSNIADKNSNSIQRVIAELKGLT